MKRTDEFPRDFKGIWIPRSLWLRKDLTFFDKGLLAEIDSLSVAGSPCYATNDYLARFFDVKPGHVANRICFLLRAGFLGVRYERDTEKANGRCRYVCLLHVRSWPKENGRPGKTAKAANQGASFEDDEAACVATNQGTSSRNDGVHHREMKCSPHTLVDREQSIDKSGGGDSRARVHEETPPPPPAAAAASSHMLPPDGDPDPETVAVLSAHLSPPDAAAAARGLTPREAQGYVALVESRRAQAARRAGNARFSFTGCLLTAIRERWELPPREQAPPRPGVDPGNDSPWTPEEQARFLEEHRARDRARLAAEEQAVVEAQARVRRHIEAHRAAQAAARAAA